MEPPEPAALLDHTVDKVAVLDESGRFRYVNAAAERILGFAPADLVGEDAFEYVHPEDREAVRDTFRRVVETTDDLVERTGVFRHRTADGGWAHLESRMSNLHDSAVGGYVVSSRDVTDRVTLQHEREEVTTRLREIARKTSEVLWTFTADWEELRFVNPAVEEVYGVAPETLHDDPTSFLEYVHPEDRAQVQSVMERLSSGESVDVEYRVNPSESYGRWVWVQGEPIVEDGEVVRIVGFSRDITDRRDRERQLAVMDTLLRHNIRNHANLVAGKAQAIAEVASGAEEAARADAGDAVADLADEIADATDSLLDTAEKQREVIELLTGNPCPVTLDLAAVAAEAAATVRDRHPAASVAVDVPEGLRVRAVDELELAVAELLENAVEHGGEPAVVRATGRRREDGRVDLVVTDSGPRIPVAEYGALTGQSELSEVTHSSGLGLWLVHWTVERSDGSLAFGESEAGGNAVTLTLEPATEPAE
ncbi:MAG: PAS domain S-box protein [Halobacteriaceae archaeon]